MPSLPDRGTSLRVGVTRTNLRLVGALLSAALFIALGVSVRDGASFRVDPPARDMVARWHTPELDRTVKALDVLGSEVGVGALVVITSAWLWRGGPPPAPPTFLARLRSSPVSQRNTPLSPPAPPNRAPLSSPSGRTLSAPPGLALLTARSVP